MEKKFLSLLTIVVVIFASVCVVSCGDDDNGTPSKGEEVESPEDNLPEASKSFIGYWRNSQSNLVSSCDFVFFPNGICRRYSSFRENFIDDGYWTFNESTNILATTVGEWQWEVTLSNSEAWAGVSLGSGASQTFSRDNIRYVLACIRNTEWECDTLTTTFYNLDGSLGIASDEHSGFSALSGYYGTKLESLSEISIVNSTITMACKIVAYRRDRTGNTYKLNSTSETITIKNYYRSNAILIFGSAPTHEYKLKKE